MTKIKKILNNIIGLFFVSVSTFGYAADWVVGISNSEFRNNYFYYTATLYLSETSFNSTLPLNYDCVTQQCWIQVNTQVFERPLELRGADPYIERVEITGSRTVGEALKKYFDAIGRQYIYTVSSSAPDRRFQNPPITWCGAMSISLKAGNGFSWETMNGGSCAVLPPPDLSCIFETDDVVLDHGTLNQGDIDGNIVQGDFKMSCNMNTSSVSMSISSPDLIASSGGSNSPPGAKIKLKEDGSLISHLSVSYPGATGELDLSQPTPVTILENGTTFTVKSQLTSTPPVQPGPFLSFAYVILSYN